MCGIFFLSGYNHNEHPKIDYIKDVFDSGRGRGPESSSFDVIDNLFNTRKNIFGFHRLAINGYHKKSSGQPIKMNNCILICNGEIYNWRDLSKRCSVNCKTGSDCEIIIHLYRKYGAEHTLQMLDGVFSFVLFDIKNNSVFIARDALGVRPLFIWSGENNSKSFLVASEIKMGLGVTNYKPQPFKPGNFIYTNLPNDYECNDISDMINLNYTTFYKNNSFQNYTIKNDAMCYEVVRNSLIDAVAKRVDNTDREIACLLSGGLDSSLITALVVNEYKKIHGPESSKMIHTWSIGMEGSDDLKYARIVADYLNTTHHEIKLTEDDFINAIPDVIYAIESNDTTTVRASVGNYLICKYIRERSDAKVIFNGDGSDEVTGGYLYFHYAPDSVTFDKECRRLLNDIYLFDVLRSDRTISCHGLEARTPFLDRNFVQSYLSIPCELRDHNFNNKRCEKYILRTAFKNMNILPEEVLYRTKEAFSDGVSKQSRSWFNIIQEYASKRFDIKDGGLAEQKYYDSIFSKYFGDLKHYKKVLPYKWMPKFVDATDSSARTLDIYNSRT